MIEIEITCTAKYDLRSPKVDIDTMPRFIEQGGFMVVKHVGKTVFETDEGFDKIVLKPIFEQEYTIINADFWLL